MKNKLENDVVFKEKFIGFMDILGFKGLVKRAEEGTGMSLPQLLEMLKDFGSSEERRNFDIDGPIICPDSTHIQRNLDFRLTQVSDCVIMSAEVSPAGVINLVHKCWSAIIKLLSRGIMCRGYITRGLIYHSDRQFLGSGYQEAYSNERNTVFNQNDEEKTGTPYVEVDKTVCDYVNSHCDPCAKEMFSRFVLYDNEITALFPFKRLAHSFMIAGFGQAFDPEREKESNMNVKCAIETYKNKIMSFVDSTNSSAIEKAKHYCNALDRQLEICGETDRAIELLESPFPSLTFNHILREKK